MRTLIQIVRPKRKRWLVIGGLCRSVQGQFVVALGMCGFEDSRIKVFRSKFLSRNILKTM